MTEEREKSGEELRRVGREDRSGHERGGVERRGQDKIGEEQLDILPDGIREKSEFPGSEKGVLIDRSAEQNSLFRAKKSCLVQLSIQVVMLPLKMLSMVPTDPEWADVVLLLKSTISSLVLHSAGHYSPGTSSPVFFLAIDCLHPAVPVAVARFNEDEFTRCANRTGALPAERTEQSWESGVAFFSARRSFRPQIVTLHVFKGVRRIYFVAPKVTVQENSARADVHKRSCVCHLPLMTQRRYGQGQLTTSQLTGRISTLVVLSVIASSPSTLQNHSPVLLPSLLADRILQTKAFALCFLITSLCHL
ncbi:unnamed protein product [Pleuronectes platessa]|uniref:Uncharacterized protein n=1 Tax=Pleuronectes platessa TaxID=8262 RepID=A0A9N7YXN0_PLEPL|nr:unnamed protein product [Pleuronectes platessa]